MVQIKNKKQQQAIKQVLDPCNEYEGLLYGGLDVEEKGICIHVYKASCVEITFEQMQKIVDILRPKGVLDMSIVAPEMQEVVDTWMQYKKEKKQSYKPTGFKTFYKNLCELSGNNPQVAMAIIEQSMRNNYAGIFPLRNNNNNNNYGRETITDKIRRTLEDSEQFQQKLDASIREADLGFEPTDEEW